MLDGCAERCWRDARTLQTENKCLGLLELLWSVTKATVSSVLSSFKFKNLMGIAGASAQLRGQCPFMCRELPEIIPSLLAVLPAFGSAVPKPGSYCTEVHREVAALSYLSDSMVWVSTVLAFSHRWHSWTSMGRCIPWAWRLSSSFWLGCTRWSLISSVMLVNVDVLGMGKWH